MRVRRQYLKVDQGDQLGAIQVRRRRGYAHGRVRRVTIGRPRGCWGCGRLRGWRGGCGRGQLPQDGRHIGGRAIVAGAGLDQLDHGDRVEDDQGGQDDHGDGGRPQRRRDCTHSQKDILWPGSAAVCNSLRIANSLSAAAARASAATVSYTHLTLPTSDLV